MAGGDGSNAHIMLKPGKNHDGYFSNDDVLGQATQAMNILKEKYPNERHILVFDNAHTHSKHAEDAISAAHMPCNPKNWGVTVPAHDADGKILYQSDGKPCTTVKHMANTIFNGQQQSLYFPDDHPKNPGEFKGMAQILREHGHSVDHPYLKAECKNFAC